MREVYIVAAARTAIGSLGGALKTVQPETLAAEVLKELPKRAGITADKIDSVILGQTRQSTDAANIARVALLMADYPETVPAYTIMMQCSSGMQAIHSAVDSIRCGNDDIVVAGGVESLSNAIFYLRNARYGLGVGTTEMVDSITEGQIRSQPLDKYGRFGMGDTAENVAEKYGITRERQDAFAYQSQMRTKAAMEKGIFDEEIVPVYIPQRKGDPICFDKDEFPRPNTTLEGLAKLKPVFRKDGKGSVTAGNACGRNDGAAALLLMSGEKVKELGIKPMAKLIGYSTAGVDPRVMGIGPVPAVRKVLKQLDMTIDQMDLVELNEAFAAQALACVNELGIDQAKLNVNGGAIALGHPSGSTGARLVATLCYEMQRRPEAKYALATMCVGGGFGSAIVIERV